MIADDRLLSIQDVYNVVSEHMNALDHLWPDSEPHGPRKVHIVEIIDGIKLKLVQRAEKNASKYESPFEKAAKKITGTTAKFEPRPGHQSPKAEMPSEKTAMQIAHEAAQSRMKK
jgi:hypothetical protein